MSEKIKCEYCNRELTEEEIEKHEHICDKCLSELTDITGRSEN